MANVQRAQQLLEILRQVTQNTRSTIQQESPGIFDRALILGRLSTVAFRVFIENPAARSLAKIGGARRLASKTYFAAQQNWMEAGHNERLAAEDPELAKKVEQAYFELNAAVQGALEAENKWMKLPENILDQAVAEFFSGLLETLERWINFAAAPFGIPWGGILLGLGVLIAVIAFKRAS